jgi:predicted nucleic acid-binding protein
MPQHTILIDSNIIIYAINRTSPKHLIAQKFLQDNIANLAVAQQNILESLMVLTHRKFEYPMETKAALKAVSAISDKSRVLAPSKVTGYIFMDLLKKYSVSGDKIFDIYLVSTALSSSVNLIATDNINDFAHISEVKTINPFV